MIYHCMGCKKRYPGCHDVCEEYHEDKERVDLRNKKIRKNREDEETTLSKPKKKTQRNSKWR